MRKTVLFMAATFLVASNANSQTQACPSNSGVYALKDSQWLALSIARANKEKMRTGFPYHGVAIAVYQGASSSVTLYGDVTLCASGVSLGSTFALAKAKEKKSTREVKVGTYSVFTSTLNFSIDKSQDIPIQIEDKNGIYTLHNGDLRPGQYILFLQAGTSLSSIPPAFDFTVQ